MPKSTQITEIMQKDVFSVDIEDTIRKADELMRSENIRHIPVTDSNKFIGLITDRSLMEYNLRQLYDYDEKLEESGLNKISEFQDVLSKNINVIYPEDSIQKAIEIMAKKKTDCLPVVDWDGNLKGIVTYIDVLLFFKNIFSGS